MAEADAARKQEELRSLVAQLESGKNRLEILGRQIQYLESSLSEISATKSAIEAIEKNRKGAEILVPLGTDSYVKATLKDEDTVLVGVGARISMEKTAAEAKKTLDERGEEAGKALKRLQESYIELSGRLAELNESAERYVSDIRGQ